MKKSFSIPKSGPGGRGGAGQGRAPTAEPRRRSCRGGGSRRGSAEPGHRRHGRPGPSGAEAELTAPPSPRTAGGGGRLCRRSARLPAATAAARAVPPPRYLRKCFKAPAPRSQRVPCLCSPVSVAPLRPRKPFPSGVVALRFGRLVGVIPSASERLQQRSSPPLRRDLLVTPM